MVGRWARNQLEKERKMQTEHSSHSSEPKPEFRILDALVAQTGSHWIKYGVGDRFCWFSIPDLQRHESDVIVRLSDAGIHLLSPAAKSKLKTDIEAHTRYRHGLVALRPGWIENHFVLGDGTVLSPPRTSHEVIVAFEPRSKFKPKGSLASWQREIGTIIAKQPLPLFALGVAFAAPLLRFTKQLNPQIEFVGDPECGKSSAGFLAASVWAGDPTSEVGGGESWDLTLNGLDQHKADHSDSLLFLDEAALLDSSTTAGRGAVKQAVFKVAKKGGKKRYTDTTIAPNVNVSLFSTSNMPILELLKLKDLSGGAITTRMITIQIAKGKGLLDSLPDGFKDMTEAINKLLDIVNREHGTAGQTFAHRLVLESAADEKDLIQRIRNLVKRFRALMRLEQQAKGSARVEEVFAIIYAASYLARKWGVIPESWKSAKASTLVAYRRYLRSFGSSPPSPAAGPSAHELVKAYAKRERKNLIRVEDIDRPLNPKKFKVAAGFTRGEKGHRELLVPTLRFQQQFPGYQTLLKELKKMAMRSRKGVRKRSCRRRRHVELATAAASIAFGLIETSGATFSKPRASSFGS
ncbi:hypothetical protein X768_01630 [Mesorhizobium sp. LSJC265A00]|nr:hypothetical protein X768_01630 [Mesorhizobium sp. LSJC265A00]